MKFSWTGKRPRWSLCLYRFFTMVVKFIMWSFCAILIEFILILMYAPLWCLDSDCIRCWLSRGSLIVRAFKSDSYPERCACLTVRDLLSLEVLVSELQEDSELSFRLNIGNTRGASTVLFLVFSCMICRVNHNVTSANLTESITVVNSRKNTTS